ncbi:MAG: tetratricopeptide repeat protein [Candidatus Hydrogenedens sp.]|nr:tetratricopeptide repeat protein [Candidatus Hydrogenedens sp.]
MGLSCVFALLALAADFSGATMDELKAAADKARTHYDLELGQSIIPELQTRINSTADTQSEELRWVLAEDTLLVASLLRYRYEKPDTSNTEKRSLGEQIDQTASIGFTALGGLPDTSEKHRIMSDLYAMMMRTRFKGNRFQEAMHDNINKALELDPKNAKALVSQSRRKLFAEEEYGGDFEGGLALINEAIELDPTDESAYILRGLAYEQHDEPEKALADWEKALEINPDARPAQEHLDRVRAKLAPAQP